MKQSSEGFKVCKNSSLAIYHDTLRQEIFPFDRIPDNKILVGTMLQHDCLLVCSTS